MLSPDCFFAGWEVHLLFAATVEAGLPICAELVKMPGRRKEGRGAEEGLLHKERQGFYLMR
jgi:hypothetical protein